MFDPSAWTVVEDQPDPSAYEDWKQEDLEREVQKYESKIDKSKKRMMKQLAQTEEVATNTLHNLHTQREQIRRIEQDQNTIEFHQHQAEHYGKKMRGMLQDGYYSDKKGISNWIFGRRGTRGVARASGVERALTHEC